MSMNVQLDGEDQALNSTINTTPLVDVMLVLLIIFLITVPVINKRIHVDLPDAANIATQTKPENIVIAVTANGDIYWNNAKVADTTELLKKIEEKAVVKPQPEIHHLGRQGSVVPVRRACPICNPARRNCQSRLHHPA